MLRAALLAFGMASISSASLAEPFSDPDRVEMISDLYKSEYWSVVRKTAIGSNGETDTLCAAFAWTGPTKLSVYRVGTSKIFSIWLSNKNWSFSKQKGTVVMDGKLESVEPPLELHNASYRGDEIIFNLPISQLGLVDYISEMSHYSRSVPILDMENREIGSVRIDNASKAMSAWKSCVKDQ